MRPFPHFARSLLVISIAGASMAFAEEPVDPDKEAVLKAVTVKDKVDAETATGPVAGYIAKRSATATKTDTSLLETPQSVTVVTADQIVDLGAMNVQDALNYAAGVRSDAYGLDSRADAARVRGSEPVEYLDGLRQSFNYYTSTIRNEPYMLERIEVLRGPAAMLYGQGSTAGVVNLVSKRPQAEARGEVGVKLGSHDLKQIQTDVTGPLTEDGTWLYRVIALVRDADTQVDHVRDDRRLLAPSLTWQPSDATSLTLQLRWQEDKSGSTAQFLPWEGYLVRNPNGRIPTSRFIGEPDFDRYDTERLSMGWVFEHHFNDQWALHHTARYIHNNVDYRSLYADSFANAGDSYIDPQRRMIGRIAWITQPTVRMFATDQYVEGQFKTGPLQHRLIAGLDALRFRQTSKSAEFSASPIDVYDPVYTGFDMPPLTENPKEIQQQLGAYVQDQIEFGDRWIAVLGLREDRVTSDLEGSKEVVKSATSARAGLLYKAAFGVAPYVSYSESFTPQSGFNAEGDPYKPLRGEQWEVGVKYQPETMPLSATLSVYDLRETNRRISEPGPQFDRQVGKTRTKGAELEARAHLGKAVDLIANYNYTNIDDELEALPENQASVWAKWNFAIAGTPGFSVGTGVRWFDAFKDGGAPTTPSVTLVDGLLAWDLARWRFAVNANNLTDKRYVSTCLSRGDCFVGNRRNVVASATYRW